MMAALILAWLSAHFYGPVQRDVVFAVAQAESGLRPEAVSLAGDAGLFQLRGPRRRALARYERRRLPAIRRAQPWLDRGMALATAQLEFMDAEWRAMPSSRAFFAMPDSNPGRIAARRLFRRDFERCRGCQ